MPIDRRRRERVAPFDHGEPLLRANSLPFAILFSTIALLFLSLHKPPHHSVVIEVPVSSGLGRPFEPWPEDLPRHFLRVTGLGQIWWDNDAVNLPLAAERLQTLAMASQEGLVFLPDGDASYDRVARMLNEKRLLAFRMTASVLPGWRRTANLAGNTLCRVLRRTSL